MLYQSASALKINESFLTLISKTWACATHKTTLTRFDRRNKANNADNQGIADNMTTKC